MKRKIRAFYIGDFRFTKDPIGKYFFNYNDKTKTFIMNGHEGEEHPFEYTLGAVLGDDDFILLELLEGTSGNPLDNEIRQISKKDFEQQVKG